MLGTGGAFNVQLTPTEVAQQAAAQATTQATGRPSPADTDLIQPTSGMLQTGVDGYEAYYDSYNTLRDFADTAFIQYGIDVTKPDPRIPGSAAMVRAYNRMFSDTQNLGMQLRSGYEYNKMLQEQALSGEIFLPAQFANGQISTSQTNLGALSNKTLEFIENYNKAVNDTKIVGQAQLQSFETEKAGLIDWLTQNYRNSLVEQGYDSRYVDLYIEDQVRRVRQPTMDEHARQTLSQEWQGLSMRERELRAKETTGGQQQEGGLMRKGLIYYAQNPRQYPAEAEQSYAILKGSSVPGGGRITDVFVTDIIDENGNYISDGLRIDFTKDNRQDNITIDLSKGTSFFEINDLFNSIPGEKKYSQEDLSRVPSFSPGNVQLNPTQAPQTQNPNDPLGLGI